MSDLPKAVQAQLDQAEALQAQLTTEAAPTPVENPAPVSVPEQPALQPAPTEQQVAQTTSPVTSDTWEQRFRIMEGKFKAEVPRLYEQNRDLSERLEQAVTALQAKEKPSAQDAKLVVDADVETFGADLVDLARRVAREEFSGLYAKLLVDLDARFGSVTEKVQKTEREIAKSVEDKFWDAVLEKNPDFDGVNEDPRWFAFLDVRVPGARFTRRALAENAIRDRDAVSLNEQLHLFKESITQPAQAPAKPKPNLNSQVAPNTSSASAPTATTASGRIWTGQEYAAALDHRNLQKMTRADYESQIAEAETALAEGRVRF